MTWLTSNWRWAILNLVAVFVLAILLSQGSTDWNAADTFDPGLESGKWAMRLLLICLAMSPLKTYFGWRGAIALRKPAGLWSFGFAIMHVLLYIRETQLTWLTFPVLPYIALGLVGLLVLSALALTSNRWAMRRLKKQWKRLHRLVYLTGPTVVAHAILAANSSKKMLNRDPQALHELNLYLALLAVLLVARIPLVRRGLKQIARLLRPRGQVDQPVTVVTLPDRTPAYRPQLNGRAADVSLDDFLSEVQPEEEVESQ